MVALPLGPNVLLNPREEACSVLVYWTSLHREISVIFNIQTSVIMNSPRSWSPKQSLECWCLGWLSATDYFRASRAFYRSQQEWTLSLSSTATMSSSLGCRYLKICQTKTLGKFTKVLGFEKTPPPLRGKKNVEAEPGIFWHCLGGTVDFLKSCSKKRETGFKN